MCMPVLLDLPNQPQAAGMPELGAIPRANRARVRPIPTMTTAQQGAPESIRDEAHRVAGE
jgi:hypothetical protein